MVKVKKQKKGASLAGKKNKKTTGGMLKSPAASSTKSSDGNVLSAEISELVHSMAGEAEEIGEEWTTEANRESDLHGRSQVEDAEAKRIRLAKAATEDAEILGGSSDAEFSDSSDDQDGTDKPLAAPAADAASRKQGKKTSKIVSREVASDKSAQEAEAGPAVQKPSTKRQPRTANKDKATAQPVVEKRNKQDGQVFLSGLPFSVDEATVRSDFGKFGEITRFYFHRDANKRPLGTACIYYKTQELADKVLLLDGIDYKGRAIKVKSRGPRQSGGKRTKAAKAAWERMPDWKVKQQSKLKNNIEKGPG